MKIILDLPDEVVELLARQNLFGLSKDECIAISACWEALKEQCRLKLQEN